MGSWGRTTTYRSPIHGILGLHDPSDALGLILTAVRTNDPDLEKVRPALRKAGRALGVALRGFKKVKK